MNVQEDRVKLEEFEKRLAQINEWEKIANQIIFCEDNTLDLLPSVESHKEATSSSNKKGESQAQKEGSREAIVNLDEAEEEDEGIFVDKKPIWMENKKKKTQESNKTLKKNEKNPKPIIDQPKLNIENIENKQQMEIENENKSDSIENYRYQRLKTSVSKFSGGGDDNLNDKNTSAKNMASTKFNIASKSPEKSPKFTEVNLPNPVQTEIINADKAALQKKPEERILEKKIFNPSLDPVSHIQSTQKIVLEETKEKNLTNQNISKKGNFIL